MSTTPMTGVVKTSGIASGTLGTDSNELYIQGIGTMDTATTGSAAAARKQLTLSPISRPKASLSPKMKSGLKSSQSTGCLKRNKISFGSPQMLVFEKDIDNEDEEHKNSVWYSKKEMKSIRKDLKKSIKKGEITRGLEQYEGDMGTENKQKRLNHIYSILDLQREQQEQGIQCDKSLQMLSRAMSADDIGRARRLASMDSTEAFSEYTKTQSSMIRTSSRNALDNFRKTVVKNNSKLALAQANGLGPSSSSQGGGGKNATFGSSTGRRKKSGGPNLLLAAMANRKKATPPAQPGAQAGVA
ncbi:expressed unknown protein [Seminavis robusta]|uniref:Uncharacterized protein n=1 Tax=Seminavis robusta TaxID=568900 RepID=A0A9N8DS11_9STRA|nr:expressed unknown protein [Seminavis robusta]|eukprot:Sro314_g115090.1 n/a (300) ;mRNA; f:42969-43868